MASIRCSILGYPVVVIAMVCQFGYAQNNAGSSSKTEGIDPMTTTRITLGSVSGAVGTSVVVPIYFTPAPGVSVGHLKLKIQFVSANMKFRKLERGIAAEMANIDLKTDLKDGKNDQGVDNSTLTIDATAPSGGAGMTPGLLGYINLDISATGRPAKISMRTSAEAEETGGGKSVSNLKSFDGEVEVIAAGSQPAVLCFFFSH